MVKSIYSGYALCDTLDPSTKCFRVLEFQQTAYRTSFHEHVPRHRISEGNAVALMKTLMCGHRDIDDASIILGYLNARGKSPPAIKIGSSHLEYPEPGVLRRYISHGDISVSFDEVIDAEKFRR